MLASKKEASHGSLFFILWHIDISFELINEICVAMHTSYFIQFNFILCSPEPNS